MKTFFFFFLESTCACVLGPWPWPRAFLSLASRVSVLGKAGLGFVLCPWPWPWPRALCPRLHLCPLPFRSGAPLTGAPCTPVEEHWIRQLDLRILYKKIDSGYRMFTSYKTANKVAEDAEE